MNVQRLNGALRSLMFVAVLLPQESWAQSGGNGTIYVGTYHKKILVVNESNLRVVDSIPVSVGIPTSMILSSDRKHFYVLDPMFENVRREKFVNLLPALEKRCAEMNVEELQVFVSAERDFGQQTAARLALVDRNIEILRMTNGQAREHGVAVKPAFDLTVFAEEKIHLQLFGDEFGLMIAPVCSIWFSR